MAPPSDKWTNLVKELETFVGKKNNANFEAAWKVVEELKLLSLDVEDASKLRDYLELCVFLSLWNEKEDL